MGSSTILRPDIMVCRRILGVKCSHPKCDRVLICPLNIKHGGIEGNILLTGRRDVRGHLRGHRGDFGRIRTTQILVVIWNCSLDDGLGNNTCLSRSCRRELHEILFIDLDVLVRAATLSALEPARPPTAPAFRSPGAPTPARKPPPRLADEFPQSR